MIRISGGIYKGKSIEVPSVEGLRPTLSKIREAVFHSLVSEIESARVLDLFAGAGTMGIEALSREAESAVFVESHAHAIRIIQKNIAALGLKDKTTVIRGKVAESYPKILREGPYDFVFGDPPYELNLTEELGAWDWSALLKDGGSVWIEHSKRMDYESFGNTALVKTRQKRYGDTVLSTFQVAEIGEKA